MPNHVLNEITIKPREFKQIESILADVVNSDGAIDFEVLLPIPLNYWHGSVGIEHEKAFQGTALDFSRKAWGTKWNAYGQGGFGRYDPIVITPDGRIVLTFQTAWSMPRGWVVAIFNKHKVDVCCAYLDEGASSAVIETFSHGETIDYPKWQHGKAKDAETERLSELYWGKESWAEIKAEQEVES